MLHKINPLVLGAGAGAIKSSIYFAYLKNMHTDNKINVVFNLEGTLITTLPHEYARNILHNIPPDLKIVNGNYSIWKRPLFKMLYPLSHIANIHIFTAKEKPYVDELLSRMMPLNIFDKVVCYEDWDSENFKDLTKISTNLNKIILVDHNEKNSGLNQHFYHMSEFKIEDVRDGKLDKELLYLFGHILKLYTMADVKYIADKIKDVCKSKNCE